MPSDDRWNPYAPPKAGSEGPGRDDVAVAVAEPSSTPSWTTVTVYPTTERAVEALRRLEKAEITCRVLQDGTAESSVALHWVRSMPLGGYVVQVHTPELDEASALLGVELDPEDAIAEPRNQADERMKQAFLGALLGAFVCPGIAQMASLWLILITPGVRLTSLGRKHRFRAFIVDVIVLGIIAFVLATEPTSVGTSLPVVPRSLSH